MKKLSPRFVSLAAVLCTSLFFSCTSDVEILPPPPPVNTSSGSEQVWSYCIYPEIQECYQGSYSACPGGGTLSENCPFATQSSSSLGGNATASSSSRSGQSSSGAALEYAYCVFATERMCLDGPVSSCPPSGVLSNDCPYSSSSSSLGGVSSSSVASNPSSSDGGGGVSSESQELGTFDGTYFTDPRDGKKYKYEIAPAAGGGKIWMKENLNYSRGNTLGYCYVVNGKNLGTAGADLSGCDSPYGRIYTYSVAIDGNKPQGLCPKGWHIPSVDEWATLGAGTASSITGTRRMSSAFYVYSGNYDYAGYQGRAQGWYERDKNGFYWTNNNKNSFVMMGTSNGNYFYSKSDATDNEYYSIRCVADDGVFSSSSRVPQSSSSAAAWSGDKTPCANKEIYIKLPSGWGNDTYILWEGQLRAVTGVKYNEWTKLVLPRNLSNDNSPDKAEIVFSDYDGTYNGSGIYYITRNVIEKKQQLPNQATDKFKCSDFGVDGNWIIEDPYNPGKTLLLHEPP